MQIFIVIIAILIFLLYISITICVTIEDDTMIAIKYGVFKFKINLDKEKPDKPEKKDKPPKPKPKTTEKTENKKKASTPTKKKKSIITKIKEALAYVKPVLSEVFPMLIKIIKCVKFQKVKVIMFVASSDAHQTALDYAKTSIAVANAVSLLQLYSKIDIDRIEVNADFLSENSVNNIYFEVKFRPLFILNNIIKLLFKVIIAIVKTSSSVKMNNSNNGSTPTPSDGEGGGTSSTPTPTGGAGANANKSSRDNPKGRAGKKDRVRKFSVEISRTKDLDIEESEPIERLFDKNPFFTVEINGNHFNIIGKHDPNDSSIKGTSYHYYTSNQFNPNKK